LPRLPKGNQGSSDNLVSKKDRLAVVAALYDMLWHTRKAYTRPPRHVEYYVFAS
jgi:hypothetical protein